MMPWIAPVAILAAGAVGGVVNLLMNGNGGIELGGMEGDAEGTPSGVPARSRRLASRR